MENSHAMFEFYWRQKQQQAEAQYIENNEPEDMDEENKTRRISTYLKHLLTFISRKLT